MSYVDFSSWPREQEQTFVVFEERANESQKKAWMVGIAAGVAAFIFAVGIYAGVTPDKKDLSKDMNMSNLSKKGPKAEAPAPAAAPAPKAEAPAPAPAPAATP